MKTFNQFREEQTRILSPSEQYIKELQRDMDTPIPAFYIDHAYERIPFDLLEAHIYNDWTAQTSHVIDSEKPHLEMRDKHVDRIVSNPHLHNAVLNYIHAGTFAGDKTGSRQLNDHLVDCHNKGVAPPSTFVYKDKHGNPSSSINLHHLDEATQDSHLHYNLTSYSGVQYDPQEHMDHRNSMLLPAYTSTSLNRGVAANYAKNEVNGHRHIIQINHIAGQRGLYIGNSDHFGKNKHDELIMPRNTKIGFLGHEIHHDSQGNSYKIWKAQRYL